MPNTEKAKRQTLRAPFTIFLETAEALGLTETALAEKLGYSGHVFHSWRLANAMPAVAANLCRALVQLHQAVAPLEKDAVILVRVPKGEPSHALLLHLLSSLKLEHTTV